MTYNRKEIMKRAWEIKKDADRRTLHNIKNKTPQTAELKPEEKAIFSECLKLAWAEVRKAEELAEKLKISAENALKLAEKEHELVATDWTVRCVDNITWKLWSGYGHKRAYFRVAGWSKYANSHKYNFVELI